jgi:hypothetical protein
LSMSLMKVTSLPTCPLFFLVSYIHLAQHLSFNLYRQRAYSERFNKYLFIKLWQMLNWAHVFHSWREWLIDIAAAINVWWMTEHLIINGISPRKLLRRYFF